jgi:hypothetical protein
MSPRGPLATLAVLGIVAGIVLGAGSVAGVGPLATSVPPDRVTDPAEMLARSLQATLDASAVHLEGHLSGHLPGALLDRPEPSVSLDGTALDADIRPHDGRTRAHLSSPGLDLVLDTVTVWNDAWYRTWSDGPWERASLGAASAGAGVDINPLTLVDRLRSYLATPGLHPTARDVACASASGRCHEIRLDAGPDPVGVLAALLPHDHAARLPVIDTIFTLQTDRATLRPARLIVDATSADGSLAVHLELDASRWDTDLRIDEPPAIGP